MGAKDMKLLLLFCLACLLVPSVAQSRRVVDRKLGNVDLYERSVGAWRDPRSGYYLFKVGE